MRSTSLTLVAAALLVGGGLAVAQHEKGAGKKPHAKVIAATDIHEEVDGKKAKASFVELTLEPGAAGSPHRHPGPVFGYVLEGDVEFAVNDDEARKLKAGDTFYEPSMALHAVMRNPSDKVEARVMVVLIHPRDAKQLAIPEPGKKN
ncbi:MAG TPA: cupin domain-containing protein [Lacipirellulaceae bacterium]|nr:cupin domain-containing protein [Lacipirellulaceae bacterium]